MKSTKMFRGCFVICVLALMTACLQVARAQTCTPGTTLKPQGYLGGCSNVSVLWFTQTNQAAIDHFDLNTFAGRFSAPASARSFSIPTSCGSGGQVIITEVRANGSTCAVQYSGNLPHNRPCDQCGATGGNRMATRHAASYRGDLAPGTIGVAFGDGVFTPVTELASTIPLPTTLGGVRLLIDDREVPLFYVSPSQINFYAPEWLAEGLHAARAISPDGTATYGDILINKNSPGVFTIDANGTGQAAAVWLILSRNGLARYVTAVDATPGERVFLVLYGSGITERTNYFGLTTGKAVLRVVVGNTAKEFLADYSGPANATALIGLNQLNFEIPQPDLWTGLTGAQLTVWNTVGQSWQSQGFSILGRR